MDKKLLVKTLSNAYCTNNKTDKKFSEAWLSEVTGGGLYATGMYKLYLKANFPFSSHYDEVLTVLQMLKETVPDAYSKIWAVRIYDMDDRNHCDPYEIPVLSEEVDC